MRIAWLRQHEGNARLPGVCPEHLGGGTQAMINPPHTVVRDDFQSAWLDVVKHLMSSGWKLRNLVVQVRNPGLWNQPFHNKVELFTKAQHLLGPRHVAYTIFPHQLYRSRGNALELFSAYNRPGGLFERVKTGWGTYFGRMTNYHGSDGPVNQLDRIIRAIRDRKNLSKAAYTIVIQNPGGETVPASGRSMPELHSSADRAWSRWRSIHPWLIGGIPQPRLPRARLRQLLGLV